MTSTFGGGDWGIPYGEYIKRLQREDERLFNANFLKEQIKENQRHMAHTEFLMLGGGVDPNLTNCIVTAPTEKCDIWMPHGQTCGRGIYGRKCGRYPCELPKIGKTLDPTIQDIAKESYENSSLRNVPISKKLLLLEEVV